MRFPTHAEFLEQSLCTPAFKGALAFCSNFHPAPVFGYATVEHAFQAAKTDQPAERARIRAARSPGMAKRLGRAVTLRPDWEDIRLTVMETLVREKFTRHPQLAAFLLRTDGIELVELNTWSDRFWGRANGRGENHLGQILMRIRAELAAAQAAPPTT